MIQSDVIVYFIFIFLALASVNDFYNKKVSNGLIVFGGLTVVVMLYAYVAIDQLQALGYALIIALILHKMRALGGGDCKLLLVISPLITLEGMLQLLLVSSGIFLIVQGVKFCMKKGWQSDDFLHWLKRQERFTYSLWLAYTIINITSS